MDFSSPLPQLAIKSFGLGEYLVVHFQVAFGRASMDIHDLWDKQKSLLTVLVKCKAGQVDRVYGSHRRYPIL